jgi:septum formation protein
MATRLILASGSQSRRQMLVSAGVTFEVVPSEVDEDGLRRALEAEGIDDAFPQRVAAKLAMAKAEDVARRMPGALVIGADQVLHLDGETDVFTKPDGTSAARKQLRQLAGKTHWLHAAVALAEHGRTIWADIDSAEMTMRAPSDAFLDQYLSKAGDQVCASVGAYQLEGLGVQLFERIEGDYFTILGMPLLPLLAELRRRGVISA